VASPSREERKKGKISLILGGGDKFLTPSGVGPQKKEGKRFFSSGGGEGKNKYFSPSGGEGVRQKEKKRFFPSAPWREGRVFVRREENDRGESLGGPA